MADEVRDIPFGQAIKISLDNYYDLLKTNVGSLQAEEFLQLKLVADPLDINQDQYEFFSYYTMLVRSDAAIEPQPVGGEIVTSAATLASVYGRFLQKLRGFIVQTELTADDQKTIASLDLNIEDIRKRQGEYFKLDVQEWKEICEVRGIPVGDSLAYFQWSSRYGHINEIEQLTAERQSLEFKRRTILNREYAKPEDKDVVTAEADFENPGMRLRYPMYPDYVYGRKFTLEDLARMDLGSTALFDDRRAVTWNQSLITLKTAKQGSLNAVFDKNTGNSNSIATDWSASGSAGYWFLKVRANASEATKVSEEFSHATGITLSSEAAFRVNIIWPKWFQPVLFQHTRVRENARDFSEFFGANGSLRYYPTALILVRGFKTVFTSSQNWTYDYDHNFNASVGGGFSVFGINFGGSSTYGSHVTEHKFDKSQTDLTVMDAPDTLRFVGLAVKETRIPGADFVPISLPGPKAAAFSPR